MSIQGQKEDIRKPAVAGSFYPGKRRELNDTLRQLFTDAGEIGSQAVKPGKKLRAVISPHAAYAFSGMVAASAISAITPGTEYDNIFLIGSSHRTSFNGASVYSGSAYETPLGTAKVNTALAKHLCESSDQFTYNKEAHRDEHSLEVQIPLLQYHLGKDITIVPILIGTHNSRKCKEIATALLPYFNGNNLFVISSDFSHYPSFSDALKVDKITLEALISGQPGTFINTLKSNSGLSIGGLATSMCAWTSALVLMHLAETEPGLAFNHIMYRNSGHFEYGDRSAVVGYHSIALIEENSEPGKKEVFSLCREDQVQLLDIARQNISSLLNKKHGPAIDESLLPDALLGKLGAFVTLNTGNKLRGCVGRFMPSEPLYQTVKAMSAAAAFNDSRFDRLSLKELDEIKIEISVLSPMKKINDINEIILGRHGVYLEKGCRSGTFLPQVAGGRNWTVSDFLGHISRDKAGLGWTGWKDADIYIYEAFVFGEE